jgi:hypothetical protein
LPEKRLIYGSASMRVFALSMRCCIRNGLPGGGIGAGTVARKV